jgi:hypothetical protein
MILRLTEEHKAIAAEQQKLSEESRQDADKSSPSFTFRLHMNFSRLFDIF